jgi:heterodisulfide reductase subunit C
MAKYKTFAEEVEARSGQRLNLCYQCLKCFVGCPMCNYMDYKPNSIIRMIQYGEKEKLLSSNVIWMCVSCMTCGVRCPNDIDMSAIIDALKEMSIEAGLAYSKEKKIVVFHEEFVRSVRMWGRLHEVTFYIPLILRTLTKTKMPDLMATMRSAVLLLSRFKLPFIPKRIEKIKEIEAMYKKGYKTKGELM